MKFLNAELLETLAEDVLVKLCSKEHAAIYVTTARLYIVKRWRKKDFWTFNASQAVEVYNKNKETHRYESY